ncbi:Uncharacterised protein [Segatella copri]|nr:Uncharacterised protein [Segatella copri]
MYLSIGKVLRLISSILLDTLTSVVRLSACSTWQMDASSSSMLSRVRCLRPVSCSRRHCSSD